MSEKNSNRFVALVILLLGSAAFFGIMEHLIPALFEAGPLSVSALPYVGGILLASMFFFLMSYSAVREIISGETHKYPA